jgi:chromosome segregation ATPase
MKKIDKILNFILGLAFIVIIAGGWVSIALISYNKSYNPEKQYQADMEELEIDLNDKFYFIETAISDLKDRMEKLDDRITDLEDADIEEMQRYSKQILNELTIYEYVLEAQHDLATGKITLEKYQERMNDLNNQWNEMEEAGK